MNHIMIAAKPPILKKARRGMQTSKNVKVTLLSFQEKFLNLSENIGISETNKYEKIIVRTIK